MPASSAPDQGLAPLLPDYDGACISNVVPALLGRSSGRGTDPDWLPTAVRHATQIVLLVVDGLGWDQLRARAALAPTLSAAEGIDRAITSVAPTTTACALTSITTGCRPSEHGLLGYRLAVDDQQHHLTGMADRLGQPAGNAPVGVGPAEQCRDHVGDAGAPVVGEG
ncbi:MAG TPA: alkaline phosphatase family protein, partial [Acidimicrobiales bacterium]|nr:alkaline phosphatase family protein [Acidimicrobiales bacterium]